MGGLKWPKPLKHSGKPPLGGDHPAISMPPPPSLDILQPSQIHNPSDYAMHCTAEEEEESMCQGSAPLPPISGVRNVKGCPDLPPPPLPSIPPLPDHLGGSGGGGPPTFVATGGGAKAEPFDHPQLEFGVNGLPMPEQLAAATAMGLPSLVPRTKVTKRKRGRKAGSGGGNSSGLASAATLPFSEPPPAPGALGGGGSLPVTVKEESCRGSRLQHPPDLAPDVLGAYDPNVSTMSEYDDLDLDKIDKKSLAGLPAKMVEQGVSARLNKLEKLTRLDESQLSGDQKNEKRRLMRLEKNRRAAAISRERKKRYIRSLEERSLIMAKHLAAMEMENGHLRQLLAQYTGAPVPPPLVPPQQLGIELTPPPDADLSMTRSSSRKRKSTKRKNGSQMGGLSKRRRCGRSARTNNIVVQRPLNSLVITGGDSGVGKENDTAFPPPVRTGLPPLIPKKEAN